MIDFEPREDCKSLYKCRYDEIFAAIAYNELPEFATYKQLILTDLFFVVHFILKNPAVNTPFGVEMCQEVENGPKNKTLDVWAREHLKSTIITLAETLQDALKYPEEPQGIFSHTRPAAKKFLFTLKETFKQEKLLHKCFPDVVWENPEREAPIWSLDDGIVLKRETTRKEPSISAWGLLEGMPTGFHFSRMKFDDIVTADNAKSVDMLEKVKEKFEVAMNLGSEGGTHRVIGTFYHHNDPLTMIRDKKAIQDPEKSAYTFRLRPATEDGSYNGKPVFLSQERLDDMKLTSSYPCQQLCDPTPVGIRRLYSGELKTVKTEDIPDNLFKVMLIDPAGNSTDGKGDSWAIGVVGIEPVDEETEGDTQELGINNIFILDLLISPLLEPEGIEQAARMYLRNGLIQQVGVEKVALSTTEIHLANALKERGRIINQENGSLFILRPGGRNKEKRIEAALAWPLANGKVHVSDSVSVAARDRLKLELDWFPSFHDDGIDMLSYTYDMMHENRYKIGAMTKRKRVYHEPVPSGAGRDSWLGF